MIYTILVFDDHCDQAIPLSKVIREKLGFCTIMADTAEYGIRWLKSFSQPQPDAILIDMQYAGEEVLNIIRQAKAHKPQLPIIIMTSYGNEVAASEAINAGANDFLTKPVSIDRLKLSLQNAMKQRQMSRLIARLERKNTGYVHLSDMVGQSDAFKKTFSVSELAASTDHNVWIDGERGTGREMYARAIHGSSSRCGKPFVTLDCENLSLEEAESILFGKVESYGKSKAKIGKLQEANGGTLYLNEITFLPYNIQQRILDVMKSKECKPVGGHESIPLNIRLMASNSVGIDNAIKAGKFSGLLFSKLCHHSIALPALRDRKGDVALLANHFLKIYAATENKSPSLLTDDAYQLLEDHAWPGNVRQLANLLYRATLLCHIDQIDAATIRLVQQFEPINYKMSSGLQSTNSSDFFDVKGQIKKLRSLEKEAIELALKHSGGCMTRAARNLGIGRSTLYRKVEEFEVANSNTAREPHYASDDAGFGG